MATALEQQIDRQAGADWRLRLAMRLAALLEGGSLAGPWPSGDQGVSHGPYQINSSVHNVTRAQANDPAFAVAFMLPRFRAGVDQVPAALWDTNPASAAALAAYYAERPAAMYPVERVRAAAGQLSGWLASVGRFVGDVIPVSGGDVIPVSGGDVPILGGLGDAAGAAGAFLARLADPAFWVRALAVALGVVLVIAGAGLAAGVV